MVIIPFRNISKEANVQIFNFIDVPHFYPGKFILSTFEKNGWNLKSSNVFLNIK